MTDPAPQPDLPVAPYVVRHTCTIRPLTDAAAVLDHGHTETCTECARPWMVVWSMQAGARDTQPQWNCTGPPDPPDWTPPQDDDETEVAA